LERSGERDGNKMADRVSPFRGAVMKQGNIKKGKQGQGFSRVDKLMLMVGGSLTQRLVMMGLM
jgi:hypothetical protein